MMAHELSIGFVEIQTAERQRFFNAYTGANLKRCQLARRYR